MAKAAFPRRGGVYRVRFDPAEGHEIRRSRPAVVVSDDHMNELSATVLVMLITSGQYAYYHWIALEPPEGGLTKPSRDEWVKAIREWAGSHIAKGSEADWSRESIYAGRENECSSWHEHSWSHGSSFFVVTATSI